MPLLSWRLGILFVALTLVPGRDVCVLGDRPHWSSGGRQARRDIFPGDAGYLYHFASTPALDDEVETFHVHEDRRPRLSSEAPGEEEKDHAGRKRPELTWREPEGVDSRYDNWREPGGEERWEDEEEESDDGPSDHLAHEGSSFAANTQQVSDSNQYTKTYYVIYRSNRWGKPCKIHGGAFKEKQHALTLYNKWRGVFWAYVVCDEYGDIVAWDGWSLPTRPEILKLIPKVQPRSLPTPTEHPVDEELEKIEETPPDGADCFIIKHPMSSIWMNYVFHIDMVDPATGSVLDKKNKIPYLKQKGYLNAPLDKGDKILGVNGYPFAEIAQNRAEVEKWQHGDYGDDLEFEYEKDKWGNEKRRNCKFSTRDNRRAEREQRPVGIVTEKPLAKELDPLPGDEDDLVEDDNLPINDDTPIKREVQKKLGALPGDTGHVEDDETVEDQGDFCGITEFKEHDLVYGISFAYPLPKGKCGRASCNVIKFFEKLLPEVVSASDTGDGSCECIERSSGTSFFVFKTKRTRGACDPDSCWTEYASLLNHESKPSQTEENADSRNHWRAECDPEARTILPSRMPESRRQAPTVRPTTTTTNNEDEIRKKEEADRRDKEEADRVAKLAEDVAKHLETFQNNVKELNLKIGAVDGAIGDLRQRYYDEASGLEPARVQQVSEKLPDVSLVQRLINAFPHASQRSLPRRLQPFTEPFRTRDVNVDKDSVEDLWTQSP